MERQARLDYICIFKLETSGIRRDTIIFIFSSNCCLEVLMTIRSSQE